MKSILTNLICIITLTINAQSQNQLIIKVEKLDGSVRFDTLDNRLRLGRHVACVIQDQYETITRLPLDSFPDIRQRILSYDFFSPQYDSLVEQIEIHPAYTFYDVDSETKLPKGTSLVPPVYEVISSRIRLDEDDIDIKRIKGIYDFIDTIDCLTFAVTERSRVYVKTFQRILKMPALLVKTIGDKTQIDTLNQSSPLLKIIKIPACFAIKTQYRQIQPAVIRIKASVSEPYVNLKKRRLHKTGGFSDLREYFVGCVRGGSSTVFAIQRSLIDRGYRVKADNILGKETKQALIDFQQKNGFEVGKLTIETINALQIDDFADYWDTRRTVKCGIKNSTITEKGLLDELIYLQAFTDAKIAELTFQDLKTVKNRRETLKVKKIKRQTVVFLEN